MPRRCTICHHPQHEEIAVSLFRDGTRATARRFQVSRPALDRHKTHLPGTFVKAQQAEVACEATPLLTRLESLMQESEKIAAAAKLEKNWPACGFGRSNSNSHLRRCALIDSIGNASCLRAAAEGCSETSPRRPHRRYLLKSHAKTQR